MLDELKDKPFTRELKIALEEASAKTKSFGDKLACMLMRKVAQEEIDTFWYDEGVNTLQEFSILLAPCGMCDTGCARVCANVRVRARACQANVALKCGSKIRPSPFRALRIPG